MEKRFTCVTNGKNGNGAGDGNRTRVASLEDWNSTIELHPQGVTGVYHTYCACVVNSCLYAFSSLCLEVGNVSDQASCD